MTKTLIASISMNMVLFVFFSILQNQGAITPNVPNLTLTPTPNAQLPTATPKATTLPATITSNPPSSTVTPGLSSVYSNVSNQLSRLSQAEIIALSVALVAAMASLFQAALGAKASKEADFRAAHRHTLEPFLPELGQSIHEILASSNVYIQSCLEITKGITSDQDFQESAKAKKWRARAINATNKLKEIRVKIRYPLWGLDEGFRTLTRLFDWLSHLAVKHPNDAINLINAGEKLRKSLDEVIRKSYAEGKPPTLIDRWTINFWDWNLKYKRTRVSKKVMEKPSQIDENADFPDDNIEA